MEITRPELGGGRTVMRLKTKEDRIAGYYVGELEQKDLTEEEVRMMHRWEQIWNLMLKFKTTNAAINTHLRLQKNKKEDISKRTAFLDMKHASSLWGEMLEVNKKAKRVLLDHHQTIILRLAIRAHDLSEANKAMSNLIKINAMDRDDPNLPDPETMKPNTYQLTINVPGKDPMTYNLDETGQLKKTDFSELSDYIDEAEIVTEEDLKIMLSEKDGNQKSQSQ